MRKLQLEDLVVSQKQHFGAAPDCSVPVVERHFGSSRGEGAVENTQSFTATLGVGDEANDSRAGFPSTIDGLFLDRVASRLAPLRGERLSG